MEVGTSNCLACVCKIPICFKEKRGSLGGNVHSMNKRIYLT